MGICTPINPYPPSLPRTYPPTHPPYFRPLRISTNEIVCLWSIKDIDQWEALFSDRWIIQKWPLTGLQTLLYYSSCLAATSVDCVAEGWSPCCWQYHISSPDLLMRGGRLPSVTCSRTCSREQGHLREGVLPVYREAGNKGYLSFKT